MMNRYLGFYRFAVPLLIVAMLMISLVSRHGLQPAAALLFLIGLPVIASGIRNGYAIPRLWMGILILPLVTSIPLLIGSQTGEATAAGARYLVAAIVLISLSQVKLNPVWILRSAALSGIVAIAMNLDQMNQLRVNWGVGFLDSAYISVMLLGLVFAQFHIDKGKPIWRLYAAVGVVCLVVVALKTGTRGAWPAMIAVFLLQFLVVDLSLKKKLLATGAGLLIFVWAVMTLPSLKSRLDLTVYEIGSYYKDNNHATSMGYRFDLWRIAMRGFLENPLWGVSYQRGSAIMDEYMEEIPASATIGNDGRSSSHNEILNALSKRGLLGAAAVLLLYLVPLRFFIRRLRRDEPEAKAKNINRSLALAGVCLVVAMIICGMTEAPMMSMRVGPTYAFFLIFLYHMLRSNDKRAE